MEVNNMLKKLMSGIVIGSMVLSMVGCSSNEQPKEQVYIIKHVDSQGNETKEQVTKEQYDKEVEELIEILKIEKCKDTWIGNPTRKGLSGGIYFQYVRILWVRDVACYGSGFRDADWQSRTGTPGV